MSEKKHPERHVVICTIIGMLALYLLIGLSTFS
jgi:hypothetical protein